MSQAAVPSSSTRHCQPADLESGDLFYFLEDHRQLIFIAYKPLNSDDYTRAVCITPEDDNPLVTVIGVPNHAIEWVNGRSLIEDLTPGDMCRLSNEVEVLLVLAVRKNSTIWRRQRVITFISSNGRMHDMYASADVKIHILPESRQ